MTAAHTQGLSYGLVGKSRYDRETHRWTFQREPGNHHQILTIGPERTFVEPSTDWNPPVTGHKFHERAKACRQIIDLEPTAAGVASLLNDLERVSQEVVEAAEISDFSSGDLISFGTCKRYAGRKEQGVVIDLVAVVSGATGDAVKVSQLLRQTHVLKGLDGHDLFAGSVGAGVPAYWTSSASTKVQQICFSETFEGPGSHLAIRNATGTTIMKPIVYSKRWTAHAPDLDEEYGMPRLSKPSPIDLNVVGCIRPEDTAASMHLHVSFNPWLESQVAVLAADGFWYVYEPRLRKFFDDKAAKSGPSNLNRVHVSHEPIPITGEWGMLFWVGGPETVVVASRTSLHVCRVAQMSPPMFLPVLDDFEFETILDLKRSPSDPAHVFVLTSYRLCWYHIFEENLPDTVEEAQLGGKLLLAWRHHLDPGDGTLHVLLQDVAATTNPESEGRLHYTESTIALIYSKRSGLVIYCTFALDQAGTAHITCDPSYLSQKDTKDGESSIPPTIALTVRSAEPFTPQPEIVGSDLWSNLKMLSLMHMKADLSVREQVLAYTDTDQPTLKQSVFGWTKVPGTREARVKPQHDFIVPDRLLSDWEDSEEERSEKVPASATLTKHYGPLFLHLGSAMQATRGEKLPPGSFQEAVRNVLQERAELSAGLYTMGEFLSTKLPVDEVDTVSNTIEEILDNISLAADAAADNHNGPGLGANVLLIPDNLEDMTGGSRATAEPQLNSVYENLLNKGIALLDSTIPGRARINLERDFRRMAMQNYLSSYGVRPTVTVQSGEAVEEGLEPVDHDIELPLRGVHQAAARTHVQRNRLQSTRTSHSADMGYVSAVAGPGTDTPDSLQGSTRPIPPRYSKFATLRAVTRWEGSDRLPSSMAKVSGIWDVTPDPKLMDWRYAREVVLPSEYPTPQRKTRSNRSPASVHKRRPVLPAVPEIRSSQVQQEPASSQPPPTKIVGQSQGISAPDAPGAGLMSSQISRKSKKPKVRRPGFN